MNPYSHLCDDFGVSVYLASKVELPTGRETVLHFFEAVRKRDPKLTDFERREGGEFVLEEDREGGSHRWLTIDGRRLGLGHANPPDLALVDEQNEWVLDAAPAHLGITGLDAEALDVLFYFDFPFSGNHDEVVAEALAVNGPLESFSKHPAGRVLNFQPTMMLALDESCQLQCRLSVETRTTAYQVRTGNYPDAPISVYFTIRQFWGRQPYPTFAESYRRQRQLLDELAGEHVIPHVVQPLARAIAAK